MIIEKNTKIVTFKEIQVGEVFGYCYDNINRYYMRIDTGYWDTKYNSVNLKSGELTALMDTEEVQKINAKLIIE
jgi:hypothetical protein